MKRLVLITMIVLFTASVGFTQDFCQGDFNYNGSVAAEDVTTFLESFGRNPFNNPCPPDGPAPLAKTGQTTSYRTGDDGDLEKGVPWPNPRFTNNGDGTVTDNLTGLIWLKDAKCQGLHCDGPCDWNTALIVCSYLYDSICGLTDGSGFGDWRLPNVKELYSLVDVGRYSPALPTGHPFINVQTGFYWSSSTFYAASSEAWFVYAWGGLVDRDPKSSLGYIWPVRGGR